MPEKLPEFSPSKNYPGWVYVSLDVMRKNLLSIAKDSVLDISLPPISKSWPYLEDDILKSGFSKVASAKPEDLTRVSSQFERILLPGLNPSRLGYAIEGLIPVLSNHSEALALSNLAQTNDCRLKYLLRVRTLENSFVTGDLSAFADLDRLSSLPMIDLAGALLETSVDENRLKAFARDLRGLSPLSEPIIFQANVETTITGLPRLVDFEMAGLSEKVAPLAFSAGFWAFPVSTDRNETIFRSDLGKANGLPDNFPVTIDNKEARVLKVDLNYSLFAIKDFFSKASFPYQGRLLGSNLINPISQHSWQGLELKNFLMHSQNLAIYLQEGDKVIDQGLF
jgi:hypothetical protein